MKIARTRIRVVEKITRRTWVAFGFDDGSFICAVTGVRRVVGARAGYTEFNDRGEPVSLTVHDPAESAP